MKALILNSGLGSRMGATTQHKPKCMLEIGEGYTLLSRQLTQLSRAGVPEAVVTTGPFASMLEAYARSLNIQNMRLTFIHNADYAVSNYILSMHLAAPFLQDENVLLLHGDLVLEDSVLYDLLHSPTSAVAVDFLLPLPEKDFKAKLNQEKVIAIGTTLFGEDCVACQPAYCWQAADFSRWMACIHAFVARQEVNVYAENAFNDLQGTIPLTPISLAGRLCNEIDNPQDMAAVAPRFLTSISKPNS